MGGFNVIGTARESRMDRRELLRTSVLLGAMLAGGRRAWAESATRYGALSPVIDDTTGLPLLKLPAGFAYRSFGWEGDPMWDGSPTPDRHDGMAAITWPGADPETFVLIRNHERSFAPLFGRGGVPAYDAFESAPRIAGLGGGTTALVFEQGRYAHTVATLTGTVVNCAGGATPWGTWLTCEEMVIEGNAPGARHHGYVFEVPAPAIGRASAQPIVDMGRMKHEAVAFDAVSGHFFLTEDNGPSGFYRFRPRNSARAPGALENGGELEMLKVRGTANADLGRPSAGDEWHVEWVRVDDPDAPPDHLSGEPGAPLRVGSGRSGPYRQGEARGGAAFRRLEGCFAHDGLIYFTDTTAGAAGTGVLWALAPSDDDDADILRCVYVSAGAHEADHIDNLCVSPQGAVLLCEDGGGLRGADGRLAVGTRVIALDRGGVAFPLVENNLAIDAPLTSREWIPPSDYRGSEFAGVCFSPRGNRLFVNIQTPGVTFEIRGPWERGEV